MTGGLGAGLLWRIFALHRRRGKSVGLLRNARSLFRLVFPVGRHVCTALAFHVSNQIELQDLDQWSPWSPRGSSSEK